MKACQHAFLIRLGMPGSYEKSLNRYKRPKEILKKPRPKVVEEIEEEIKLPTRMLVSWNLPLSVSPPVCD